MLLSYQGYFRYYHLEDSRETFERFLRAASYTMRYMYDNKLPMYNQHVDYLYPYRRFCNEYRVEV